MGDRVVYVAAGRARGGAEDLGLRDVGMGVGIEDARQYSRDVPSYCGLLIWSNETTWASERSCQQSVSGVDSCPSRLCASK